MENFDELRAEMPLCGFAVYAYSPGGPVILEWTDDSGILHTVERPSLAACLAVLRPEPAPVFDFSDIL